MGGKMKKTIIILMMLSLVICLTAQQGQQIKQNQKIKQSEEITKTKKKINYEVEYRKLQTQEKENKLKLQKLEKRHNSLVMSTKKSKTEIKTLKEENAVLITTRQNYKVKWEKSQKNHNGLVGRFQKVQAENKELKKENAKLRAELEELKPSKKKVLKKVIKG